MCFRFLKWLGLSSKTAMNLNESDCMPRQTYLLTFVLKPFLSLFLFQFTSGTLFFSFHLSLLISPALSVSFSAPVSDRSCPWLHGSNPLEGLVLFSPSFFFQLAWTVCVLTMCIQDTYSHWYTWPTVKIQTKPYKRLSDYVAVKRTRGCVCKTEG